MDRSSEGCIGREALAPDEIDLAQMEAVRGGCSGGASAAGMQEAQAADPQQAAAAEPKKKSGLGQIVSALLPAITSALGGGTGSS